ncbi:hypothetical protein GCM10022251_34580 [Phytohabitans flavus]|uniref:Uncharacterized protein n=1 Tax=Phytohabitans flavus TaxID=1076124 RepID=A0A6F8XMX7_9ACTN|nr:DUF6182 family protein [Phytohabitans flavus]BCB75184.1 hypothetical protein Pflav_015940 [Phytohabitans flavus]
MTLTQEILRTEAARRIRGFRPDLAACADLSTTAGLLAAQAEITGADTLTVVVMRRFELVPWLRETCQFATTVDAARAEPWRRAFTRTVFLAGNPINLRHRFSFDHIAQDGSVAWAGPAPAATLTALRRLLRVFDCSAEPPAQPRTTTVVPGDVDRRRPPIRRALYLATAGVSIAECLVHLNHLLVEAVLDGLVAPGDALTLHQRPRLSGVPVRFAALRVGAERGQPDRLRAYAGLTEEDTDA